uniref:type III secretion system cytoplasmic ring protein SctQ n=1 Tax=Halomonas sp. TaxID=1486246 RepID=UPI0026111A00|nr:type III secretion system cytoplasmic ring protein SctQ [Halomonas sp.]
MAERNISIDSMEQHQQHSAQAGPEVPALPIIPPSAVPVLNTMSRPRGAFTLPLGQLSLTCHLDRRPITHEAALSLGLTLGDMPARLRLDASAVEILSSPLSLQRPLTACPADVAALWLEYALLEWLEPLESALGDSIRLQGDGVQQGNGIEESDDTLPIQLSVNLTDGHRQGKLSLLLSQPFAEALQPWFDENCPVAPRPCSNVAWPVQGIAGYQTLTLAELRDLAPGDVVMLDSPVINGSGLDTPNLNPDSLRQASAVLVGERLMASAQTHRDGVRLLSRLHPLTQGDLAMASPANDNDNNNNNAQPQTGSAAVDRTAADRMTAGNMGLDQLPLRLVCEFGRLELSLGELRELDQGSVLPLSRPEDEAVDLVVNGRILGKGRVVKIGDGLGVQIVRLATDE